MTAVADRPRAGAVAARDGSWFPGWRPLVTPLLAWLASRLVSVTAMSVANHLRGDGQTIVDALQRWDGGWYLDAAGGYTYPDVTAAELYQVDIAFFPLFPFLIRAVHMITGWTPMTAGIVVSAVFGALSIVAIWLLINRVSGREVADRAAMFVAFFPGSIALSLIYAEGVMLTAAACCLLALVERRWVLAGVLGALATAARPNGIAAAAACGVAALIAIYRSRDWRALLAPVIASLGLVLYLVWLWAVTGAWNVWFRVQKDGWGEGIDFGASTWRDISQWYWRLPQDLDFVEIPFIVHMRAVGLILLVPAVVCMVRWRPPAILWTYAGTVMALSLFSQTLGARPRFLFTAFPLVVAVAWQLRGTWYSAALGASGALLAVTTIIYTTPFVVAP